VFLTHEPGALLWQNFLQARCQPDPTNSVCALKEVYIESLTPQDDELNITCEQCECVISTC